MIVDRTENLIRYRGVLPKLENALAAIRALPSREDGRYEFDGGFFMIQKAASRPADEAQFEYHKKYIDVQLILSGSEYMAWQGAEERVRETVPFDEKKDIGFKDGPKDHNILISEGMFYAVYPHDLHAPCMHFDKPLSCRKIVIKLPAGE